MALEQKPSSVVTPLEASPAVRRISSAPALQLWEEAGSGPGGAPQGLAQQGGIEVWVANRSFTQWGGGIMHKLPPPLKTALKEAGVCHFLLVCRDAQHGRLHLFDFGPVGEEITLSAAAITSESSNTSAQVNQPKIGAPGEIREQIVNELPEGALYVGSSHWCLDDIRRHNLQQPTVYKLHENDCRHYVNNLVRQVTGLEQATVQLLQHNFTQRTRAAKEEWLHSVLAGGNSSAQSTATQPSLSSASDGTTSSSDNIHLSSLAHGMPRSVSSPVLCHSSPMASIAASPTMLPAAPLLLPLLANLPTWDAPLVVLGQWMTNPANWGMVQGMGQMTMMSVGTMMGLKAAGMAHAAATSAAAHAHAHLAAGGAASVATAAVVTGVRAQMAGASGAWKAAVGAIPRLMQQLRIPKPVPPNLSPLVMPSAAGVATHAASTGMSGRLISFAPAAKALALQLKSRAAQVAAPLVAIAHSRQRQVQTTAHAGHMSASTGLTDAAVSPLASPTQQAPNLSSVLKGGLLPLPLRRNHPSPPSSFLSSSGLALPAALLGGSSSSTTTSTSSQHSAPPVRRSLWPLARRFTRQQPPAAQPARLHAATLQAAMLPEGPSTSLVTTRPRHLSLPSRTAHTKPLIKLNWAGAYQPGGLFKLVTCSPLVWLGGMTGRKQPAQPVMDSSNALMVLPVEAAAPSMARIWMWNKPARMLSPAPAPAEPNHNPCLLKQAQPLELSVSSSPASSARSWFRQPRQRQGRPAKPAAAAALPSIPEVDAAAPPGSPALRHMPSLPSPATAPRRRFLFKRSASAAGLQLSGQDSSSGKQRPARQWTLMGQSSTSFASLVALVVTHMAQMQASRLLI